MAVSVQTIVDDRIAKYVNRVKDQHHATEAAVVRELVESGYEGILRHLHARYQHGDLTFRAVAAELGLSVRELYDLFEQKGLPT
jgi:AraC-like DNA-binding protein